MLSGGDGVGGGRIDDQAAVLGGGGQIHIIDSDTGSSDDFQPASGGLKDLARDLGAAAHDEGVAERDLGAELLGAEVVGAVDVGEVLEQLQPRVAELLRDEHRGLCVEAGGDDQHEVAGGAALRAERDGECGERDFGGERK